MAKLKIWGRKTSSNVQKVLWCCDALGISFERIDIGGPFGGNNDPKYRALNPNGLVPTVEDGGLVLWESNTIIRYLAKRYGHGALYPEDLAAAAKVERWMDWQLAHLNPAITPIFLGFVRTPPEKRDMAAIEAARQRTATLWRMADAPLAAGPFLSGEELSLADVACGISVHRWYVLPVERPEMPHLAAWYKRLTALKAYQTNVMIPLE